MLRTISRTVLPFKLESTEQEDDLTGFAGLPLIHELFQRMKLPKLIRKFVKVKERGWKEWEIVESLLAMSIAGGEHMDDMGMFLSDKAYQQVIGKKGFPSSKAVERFLKRFHNEGERGKVLSTRCFVPEENAALQGLGLANRQIAKRLIELSGLETVTIENDATVVFSQKEEALGTYKGGTGYLPVVGTIAELNIAIGDEFRDGNVPPAFEVERFFKNCEKAIPSSVKHIRTRLDGAYYGHEFIEYLNARGIEFSITAEKRKGLIDWIEALPEVEWKPLLKPADTGWRETGREWAELSWVSAGGTRKRMEKRTYRYIVTRKTEVQWEMFQEAAREETQRSDRYEVIVTNMDWRGDRLIRWHYERGGSIEHVHDRIKNDLAGGVLPCAEFGANAAWWRIQCMAWNIVRALQIHALPEELSRCHLKKLRLWLICIAGRVIKHARKIILRLTSGHPSFEIYKDARMKIACLAFS